MLLLFSCRLFLPLLSILQTPLKLVLSYINFYHHSFFTFFCHKYSCFNSSASNLPLLPHLFIFVLLLICVFLSPPPLISVCRSQWLWVKQHDSTGKSKKKDTMNSNLSVEEEEAIALSPCITLIAQQDYI